MLRKFIMFTLMFSLCIGILGLTGCGKKNVASKVNESLKTEPSQVSIGEDEDSPPVPELFNILGVELMEGEVDDTVILDLPDRAVYTVRNELELDKAVTEIMTHFEAIGAVNIEKSLQGEASVITADIEAGDGRLFTLTATMYVLEKTETLRDLDDELVGKTTIQYGIRQKP